MMQSLSPTSSKGQAKDSSKSPGRSKYRFKIPSALKFNKSDESSKVAPDPGPFTGELAHEEEQDPSPTVTVNSQRMNSQIHNRFQVGLNPSASNLPDISPAGLESLVVSSQPPQLPPVPHLSHRFSLQPPLSPISPATPTSLNFGNFGTSVSMTASPASARYSENSNSNTLATVSASSSLLALAAPQGGRAPTPNRSSTNSYAFSYYSYHSFSTGDSKRDSSSSNFTAATQGSFSQKPGATPQLGSASDFDYSQEPGRNTTGTSSNTKGPMNHHQGHAPFLTSELRSNSLPMLNHHALHKARSSPSLATRTYSTDLMQSPQEPTPPLPLFLQSSIERVQQKESKYTGTTGNPSARTQTYSSYSDRSSSSSTQFMPPAVSFNGSGATFKPNIPQQLHRTGGNNSSNSYGMPSSSGYNSNNSSSLGLNVQMSEGPTAFSPKLHPNQNPQYLVSGVEHTALGAGAPMTTTTALPYSSATHIHDSFASSDQLSDYYEPSLTDSLYSKDLADDIISAYTEERHIMSVPSTAGASVAANGPTGTNNSQTIPNNSSSDSHPLPPSLLFSATPATSAASTANSVHSTATQATSPSTTPSNSIAPSGLNQSISNNADYPPSNSSTPLVARTLPTPQNPTTCALSNTSSSRDRYGFKKQTSYVTEAQYDEWWKEYYPHLQQRKKKWLRLMKDNGLSVENDQPQRFPPKSDKLKRYIRKGIPAEWRGNAWFYYAKGSEKLNANKGVYNKLCVQTAGLKNSDTDIIERDLYRTFPDNIHFRADANNSNPTNTQIYTSGQHQVATDPSHRPKEEPILITALRRLLVSFSVYQPKIGYCQSLNFLAGLLLLFMDEEKAFWMLVIITQRYLPGVHEVNLEGVNVDQGVLMLCTREAIPKLWDKIGVNFEGRHDSNMLTKLPPITLCTAAWFMSGYIGILPIETVLRVWDCFFFEDSKTFFRIALTIFKLAEPEIEKVDDPMEVFQIVQTFPKKLIDPSMLMATCFKRRNGIGHISQDEVRNMREFVRQRRQRANIAALKQQQSLYAPAPPQAPSTSTTSKSKDYNSNGNVNRRRASTLSSTPAPTAPHKNIPTDPDSNTKGQLSGNGVSTSSPKPQLGMPFANTVSGSNASGALNNNPTSGSNSKPRNKKRDSQNPLFTGSGSKRTSKLKRTSAFATAALSIASGSNSTTTLEAQDGEESENKADEDRDNSVSNDLDDYLHLKHPHGLHTNFAKRMRSLKLASTGNRKSKK